MTRRALDRHGDRRRTCGSADVEPRPDMGFSVIEVVVAVLIMGIVAVPLLDAVWTAVRSSSLAGEAAQTQTVLQDAADRVNRASLTCTYTSYAQAAALAVGWPSTQVTAVHRRFVPGPSPTVAGTWVNGGCAGPQPDPATVQMIVVTVTSPRTGVVRTMEVIKSGV